jgi:hypothetical protein
MIVISKRTKKAMEFSYRESGLAKQFSEPLAAPCPHARAPSVCARGKYFKRETEILFCNYVIFY